MTTPPPTAGTTRTEHRESDALHVCHMLHSLALGGLQNMVLRLVEATADAPVRYTVCYFGEDDSLREEFEDAGARVVALETVSTTPAGQFDPRSLARVTAFLRRESFDLVHTHVSLYVLVVGRLCARMAGTPVIGTYHNTSDTFHPSMRVLERATRRLSAVNVAVSKGVERTYANSASVYEPRRDGGDAGGFDRRTCTVYNGIDVEEFAAGVAEAAPDEAGDRPATEGPVFLTVGRYAPEKNQRALIRAMGDVRADLPGAHCYVVGSGDLEADLRETAREGGVADCVTVTGRVPSVEPYYALADAFVLPSLTEGLSVVLLEAMAAGLPVVATDVAGSGEAVADGTTGYVVPRDSASALSDAMVRVAAGDPEAMGRRGRERVADLFSIERTAASYLDVYRRATGIPATRGGP
jgi:glycosyltransferase involved in cell wall biosynthesis